MLNATPIACLTRTVYSTLTHSSSLDDEHGKNTYKIKHVEKHVISYINGIRYSVFLVIYT